MEVLESLNIITGFSLSAWHYLALFVVAIFSGFVDSIAGGGSLITLPALMASGIPPHLAIATNKIQSAFGIFTATAVYFKSRSMKNLAFGVIMMALGGALGAFAVLSVSEGYLKIIILILLVAVFLYMAFKPSFGREKKAPKIKNINIFHILVGFSVGFYDGFLGPPAGTFLIFACVALLGYSLREASINTKILNFSSNIVALAVFVGFYQVLWAVGIVMGVGQIIGAFMGSKLVLRTNGHFIKTVFLLVVGAMICKIAWDYFVVI